MKNWASVDDYLQAVPADKKAVLEHIRKLIKTTVPEAVEGISYGMPGYKYQGKPLVYFGAFKDHMSIFATPTPTAALKDKLKDFKMAKGTIQFTLEHQIPDAIIKELLHIRLEQIEAKPA